MRETLITLENNALLRDALRDASYISGGTHDFYHYPARFSPRFAAVAIEALSEVGDWVLDPFMGGGTTAAEALALGRNVIGTDINALAHFVSTVRTTPLGGTDQARVRAWAASCGRLPGNHEVSILASGDVPNLPRSVQSFVAGALALADAELRSPRQRAFARCALLRLGQWALDCRDFSAPNRRHLARRLPDLLESMLLGLSEWLERCARSGVGRDEVPGRRCLLNRTAVGIGDDERLEAWKGRVRLVLTSPPYPGVHVLYHRWQYRGRKETSAPYWIANVKDGAGASYYTCGSRTPTGLANYFHTLTAAFASMRKLLAPDAVVAQLVAFTDTSRFLPRFLAAMDKAGYDEWRPTRSGRRLYRTVPNRRWYAKLMDGLDSASEVLLLHHPRR
jgi:DNA modification methylase